MIKVNALTDSRRLVLRRRIGEYGWILLRFVILVGVGFLIVYPILYKLLASFKSYADFSDPTVIFIPKQISMVAYKTVWESVKYPKSLLTSIAFCAGTSLLQIASCSLVGYGLARYPFRGRGIVFALVILTLVIPPQAILFPLYIKFKHFFFIIRSDNYEGIVSRFKAPEPSAPATLIERFEDGNSGMSAWMVDENATWTLDTSDPLCRITSLKIATSNGAGAYVNFAAAAGKNNLGMRIKTEGTVGIIRIGANGNDAHVKRADSPTGYEELTTSKFTLLDTNGQKVTDVLRYDSDWGGLQFSREFDGWLLIENENQIDIQTVNVGIYHGSTNSEGFTLYLDNVFTYRLQASVAEILAIVDEAPAVRRSGVVENFEDGVSDFTAWMVDSNATWKLEKAAPLAGTASLKLSTKNLAGCYVNFPAEAGVSNLALRLKTSGESAVIRIGANGSDAHQKSTESSRGYHELTTTEFVFTDLNGNILEDAGIYDTPWGGFRLDGDFDGYMFIKNTNKVDIKVVNVAIYHGSTIEPYTVWIDNVTAYQEHTEESIKKIVAELQRDVPMPEGSNLDGGVPGIPSSTRDDLISDSFDDDTLNSGKWTGNATVSEGKARVSTDGIISVYGQKANAQRPAFFNAVFAEMSDGAGMGLYANDQNYLKVTYNNENWVYTVCVNGNQTTKTLQQGKFSAGDSIGIIYNGSKAILYRNNKQVSEEVLPEGWNSAIQYRVRLYGEAAVDNVYVAGGVYTYTDRVPGMSDNFDGASFDNSKWKVENIGYAMIPDSFDHPGTLAPSLKDGRLVISGEPDAAGGWAGISLITREAQPATAANPVSFEVNRVSAIFEEMNPPAVASGIGIYVDRMNFFQFMLNSWQPDTWQWCGYVNGIYFAGAVWNNGSSNTANYHFKLVFDGKQVQCYADGYLVATVDFDVDGKDVYGMLTASPSNPTRNNATIAVTFDDFITTGLVANTPSTAEEQAAAIKGITEPSRKDKRVAIPAVAPGFKATLTDITPAGYVDSEGKILKRESNKDVTVTVRVQVYDERNERAVKTEQFTFTLLKAYNPTILHDEFTAGELPNQVIGGVKVPGIPNPYIDETRLRIPQAAFEWTSPTMICIVRSFRTDLPPR